MCRVHAISDAALVVDMLLAGDITVDMGEGDAMDGDGLAVEAHAGVSPAASVARERAIPEPVRLALEDVIRHDDAP